MDLPDSVKEKLLELDAENRQLKADLSRKTATVENQEGLLTDLEEENKKLLARCSGQQSSSADVSDLQRKLSASRAQVEENASVVSDLKEKLDGAREARDAALREVEELKLLALNETTAEQPTAQPLISEEDLDRLRLEREQLANDLMDHQMKIEMLEETLSSCREEVEGFRHLATDRADKIRQLQEEKSVLEAEVWDLKNIPMATRGNSMYSEFVDERVKLEADLKKLFSESQALKMENYRLATELEETRLTALGRVASGDNTRCECVGQKVELNTLRAELRSANDEICQYRQKIIDFAARMKGPDADPVLRSQYQSLKMELEMLKESSDKTRIERDTLHDKTLSLEAEQLRKMNRVKILEDEVRILKAQISIREARDKEMLNNPTALREDAGALPAPKNEAKLNLEKLLPPICPPQATTPAPLAKSAVKRSNATPLNSLPGSSAVKTAKKEDPTLTAERLNWKTRSERRALEKSQVRATARAAARKPLLDFKPVVFDMKQCTAAAQPEPAEAEVETASKTAAGPSIFKTPFKLDENMTEQEEIHD